MILWLIQIRGCGRFCWNIWEKVWTGSIERRSCGCSGSEGKGVYIDLRQGLAAEAILLLGQDSYIGGEI